jgi:hypothetical protein
MNLALKENARRRRLLLMRSSALRSGLALQTELLLAGPLQAAGKAGRVLHWVRSRWPLLAGAAAVIAVARPRRVLSLSLKGWALWRLWRRLRSALH